MADQKKSGISLMINPDEVMYSSMSKSKEGYSYASISAKRSDSEYINISYEWKGDAVPDFAMDMMSFLRANKDIITASVEAHSTEFEEYAAKKKKEKFVPPWLNKDEEDTKDEKDPKEEKDSKTSKKKGKKCPDCGKMPCTCK